MPENSIETDGDHDAADDRRGIHVLRLPVRIERRQKEQTRQASRDAACDNFSDDVDAAFGTAVSLRQMAVA